MNDIITVETPIAESPRTLQIQGMFDLAAEKSSRLQWTISLPLDERPWHIGLVAGPSGCGKSTIARHFWPAHIRRDFSWPRDASLLDGFPAPMPIKDITALLSAVGFSSPPAWLRPFHVLSTGQQFRVALARLLAETPELAVMDEYSSVVDRTVAQIGSAALAKVVRQRSQRFIAVTCHDDVENGLLI
jgi:ABC-type glutathione transport system ATPase component